MENNFNNQLPKEFNNSADYDETNSLVSVDEILSLLIRRRIPIIFSFVVILIISYGSLFLRRIFTPIYVGSFLMLVDDPLNNSANMNRSNNEQVDLVQTLASNSFSSTNIPTLKEFLKSDKLLSPIAEKYDIKPKILSARMRILTPGKVNISRFEKPTGVLKIELKTPNPKKGLNMLKDISENYLEVSRVQRQKKLNDGLEFLNTQEPILIKKTELIEQELVNFREKNSFLEPILETKKIKEEEKIIDNQIFSLNLEKKRLENARLEIINDNLSTKVFQESINSDVQNNNSGRNISGLVLRNIDQTLLDQLLMLENGLSQARLKYKENSIVINDYKKRLESLKPLFKKNQIESIDVALRLNESKLKDFLIQKSVFNEQFSKQPQLIKEYNSIKLKLDIANQNLIGLVSARENFQLAVAQSSIPWSIIQEPRVRSIPIYPNLRRGILIYLFLSLFASISLGFILDTLDRAFHSNEEIKRKIRFPILTIMPNMFLYSQSFLKEKGLLFIDEIIKLDNYRGNDKKKTVQRFYYQEALRTLYTAINFLNADSKLKILQIVSSIPSEGKTFINILFAKTLCELDKKVLLIDSDLRKPQIHKRLGENNIRGLSNYLADSSMEIKEIIQKSKKIKNLDLITAGTIPPNPTRLLDSSKMKSTIENLKRLDYDLILIDTPPLLGISDSKIISDLSDGVILIVSLDNVNKRIPQQQLSEFKDQRKILGLITNQVKKEEGILKNQYGYDFYYKGYNLYENYISGSEENVLSKKQLYLSYIKEFYKKIKNKFFN